MLSPSVSKLRFPDSRLSSVFHIRKKDTGLESFKAKRVEVTHCAKCFIEW